MDEMIKQFVALSSKVVVLEAEHPTAARAETQAPVSDAHSLPSGVKAPAPPSFPGASDANTVKNFVDALDTYFELVGMSDLVCKVCLALVLLEGKACTWFTVQGYCFCKDGNTLEWLELHETLLMVFCPEHF